MQELPDRYKWSGMGYRTNGDGYGIIKDSISGRNFRIGAREACWNSKTETYKEASIRAFIKRLIEGKEL